MRYLFLLFGFLSCLSVNAQFDCSNGRYIDPIFESYDFRDNVIYARKQKSNGQWQDIGYDVYMPEGDTEDARPTIVLAHGGGYIDFIDQKSPDIVKLAQEFVKKGYVVISVEYREEPTVFSLFSEEAMVKAVGRALIDIRDVTCHLMDTTILHGNPYGVDPDNVIVGGVSAGAVSFLQAVFLDSLSWLPQQYQDWILEVEPNTQALLNNKYCGATVKGLVNISGALLDTNWMKAYKVDEYPAMMHVHGTEDPIVPYGINKPFGLQNLPELMGSYPIDIKAQQLGLRSELDTYGGYGHVPFLGFNLEALFGDNPIDVIFDPQILGETLDHMTEFIYSLIVCDPGSLATAIDEEKTGALEFFPNPSRGAFVFRLPQHSESHSGLLEVINAVGQVVHSRSIQSFESEVQILLDVEPGYYTVRYQSDEVNKPFTGQLLVSQ